jgi:hypothetical protein
MRDYPDDEPAEDLEAVRREALGERCPRCGAVPGAACHYPFSGVGRLPNMNGTNRPGMHTERKNIVRGLPTRERRTERPFP